MDCVVLGPINIDIWNFKFTMQGLPALDLITLQIHGNPELSELKKFFKLEYNCFTILYLFLLYNSMNQLCVYTYPFSLEHLSTTPIPAL